MVWLLSILSFLEARAYHMGGLLSIFPVCLYVQCLYVHHGIYISGEGDIMTCVSVQGMRPKRKEMPKVLSLSTRDY
jgi:hypothetical protein